MTASLSRRLFSEWFGTAALLTVVIGSGHMGEVLAQGNDAIALLANSIATGLGLWVLIELFAPISGAHFNPIVSATLACLGETKVRDALAYMAVQVTGALCGVLLAHAMFDLAIVQEGTRSRSGSGQLLSEAVATCGLLLVILLGRRASAARVPAMVGAYIASAYWFTASTSFANPAVTIARAFTRTFAGIRLLDVPFFVLAQSCGALAATLIVGWLSGGSIRRASIDPESSGDT